MVIMTVMRSLVTEMLHSVTDRAADYRTRRACEGADRRADGRSARTALRFRPVICEC